jgi:hypothetical protein
MSDVFAREFWPAQVYHIQGTARALEYFVHIVSTNHTATGKIDDDQCRHLLQRGTSK